MGCRGTQKKLMRYVQGILHDTDARRIDDHVRTCPSCRDRLAGLQAAWAALDALPAAQTASSMAPEVLQRIADYERAPSSRLADRLFPFKLYFAGTAAAIMLAGFVSGAVLSAVYFPENGQTDAAENSAYAGILTDVPRSSFSDLYLQAAGYNSQENPL